MSKNQPRERAEQLAALAAKHLEGRGERAPLSVVDQLVYSLIARRAGPAGAAKIVRLLQEAFVDWNELRVSAAHQVARAMGDDRPWALEVAQQMKDVLTELFCVRHNVALGTFKEMTPAQARNFLQSLPHVDRAVAGDVLLLSLGMPSLPFHETTARVFFRLGLTPDDRTIQSNQRAAEHFFEPGLLLAVHLYLSECVFDLCDAEAAKCPECPLKEHCDPHLRPSGRKKGHETS